MPYPGSAIATGSEGDSELTVEGIVLTKIVNAF